MVFTSRLWQIRPRPSPRSCVAKAREASRWHSSPWPPWPPSALGPASSAAWASTLQVIHQGLVQSKRPDLLAFRRKWPQPSKQEWQGPSRDNMRRYTLKERLAAKKATPYKIRKGKKDITEYPLLNPKSPSAKSRFWDPNYSRGKMSLVYQLQTGDVGRALSTIEKQRGLTRLEQRIHKQRNRANFVSPAIASISNPTADTTRELRKLGSRYASLVTSPRTVGSDGQPSRHREQGGQLSPDRAHGRRISWSRRETRSDTTGSRQGEQGEQGQRPTRSGTNSDTFPPPSRPTAPRVHMYGSAGSRSVMARDGLDQAFQHPLARAFGSERKGQGERARDRPGIVDRLQYMQRGKAEHSRLPAWASEQPESMQKEKNMLGEGERQRRIGSNPYRSSNDRFDQGPLTPSEQEFARGHFDFMKKNPKVWEEGEGRRPAARTMDTSPAALERKTMIKYPPSIQYTTAASQFLYGTSVVEAALSAARRKLYKLYVDGSANGESRERGAHIRQLANKAGIPVVAMFEENGGKRLLDKMAQGRPHNGYVLEASPLPQPPLAALGGPVGGPVGGEENDPADDHVEPSSVTKHKTYRLELSHQSAEEAAINQLADTVLRPLSTLHKPLMVVLDHVVDPQNLGAVLRSLSVLGASGVAMTRSGSAPLGETALKASAGSAEHMALFSIKDLFGFLQRSRQNGWMVYSACSRQGRGRSVAIGTIEEEDPLARWPCILVLGNEGSGLSRATTEQTDNFVSIPNFSEAMTVDSLNVSVAGALLTAAFLKHVGKQRAKDSALAGEDLLF